MHARYTPCMMPVLVLQFWSVGLGWGEQRQLVAFCLDGDLQDMAGVNKLSFLQPVIKCPHSCFSYLFQEGVRVACPGMSVAFAAGCLPHSGAWRLWQGGTVPHLLLPSGRQVNHGVLAASR